MSKTDEVRKQINQRIIESLEKGNLPFWNRPWKRNAVCGGLHHNFTTARRPYRGVNQMFLELVAMEKGFDSTAWGTFNQWSSWGCHVKKGEKSTMVVLWKPIMGEANEEGKAKIKSFFLRYFNVFNAQQVEADKDNAVAGKILAKFLPVIDTKPETPLPEDFAVAEKIVEACKADGLKIIHRGDRAFWKGDTEVITLPKRDSFTTPSHYFETLWHETSHWTELKRHTDWDRVKYGYAMGELRAELSCCYLANAANIPHAKDLDNHTAYIKSWLEQMRNDDQWIFKACKFADQAANCILRIAGMLEEETPEEDESGTVAQAA